MPPAPTRSGARSHDGFTLYDLVSYAHKRNADGPVENYSVVVLARE